MKKIFILFAVVTSLIMFSCESPSNGPSSSTSNVSTSSTETQSGSTQTEEPQNQGGSEVVNPPQNTITTYTFSLFYTLNDSYIKVNDSNVNLGALSFYVNTILNKNYTVTIDSERHILVNTHKINGTNGEGSDGYVLNSQMNPSLHSVSITVYYNTSTGTYSLTN